MKIYTVYGKGSLDPKQRVPLFTGTKTEAEAHKFGMKTCGDWLTTVKDTDYKRDGYDGIVYKNEKCLGEIPVSEWK